MTNISVIVCTYNRCESLLDTLRSFTEMVIPEDIEVEFLVLDNASTDETRTKVTDFVVKGNGRFRYLYEPTKGKGFALNHGIKEARGEIIAFTDDDAIVDRHWLKNVVKAFGERHTDCVGGRVRPLWLGERPEWLTDKLLGVLAVADHGDKSYDLMEDSRIFYGVNVAFRKDFFDRQGLYRTDLNSRGGAGNEDMEMCNRLIGAGARAVYSPDVVVSHKVFPERLTKSYFRRWHYLTGRDLAKVEYVSQRKILGVPGWMVREFGSFVKHYLKAVVASDGNSAFFYELKMIMMLSCFKSMLFKKQFRQD